MKGVAEEDAVPQGIRKVLDSGVWPGYPEMGACQVSASLKDLLSLDKKKVLKTQEPMVVRELDQRKLMTKIMMIDAATYGWPEEH